ncbi:protein root UVB sensitive 4 [Citrus sinensis]|nr:protein root UVB sensitive 4 [Citrus sinensis]
MQSTLNPISNSSSHQFQLPWKYAKPPQCISKTLKFTSKKTLTFAANSLRTSINYESEESLNKGPEPAGPTKLPVVVRGSGRVSRYFWDGNCLQLISVDGGASSFRFESDDQFRKLFKICSLTVRDFFIPKQVSGNYMGYVKWKFLHRLFSSALQVLATQAMFRAIGIGHSHSLPAAAALNWVMKDGLGRLLGFTIFPWCIDVIIPYDQSAVHRSFAVADNLGEISAKAQIQTVCFDNLGLMLAASLNMLLKNNQRLQAGLPFVVYPIFSAIDLLGIYQALKHVHLQTLTKDRLEIILDKWIESGHVPSPAEVSKDEGIDFLWSKGRQMWPIRIGCINPKGQIPKLSMMAMQSLSGEDYYFMCMEIFCRGLARKGQLGILLCLREGASSTDIILGMLQACYVRKALQLSSWWMNMVVAGDVSDLVLNEWFKLNEDSKQCAKRDMCLLNEQMSGLGWAMKNILLSTQERVQYSFVDD